MGEVVVVEGDSTTVTNTTGGFTIGDAQLQAIARKVIARLGDHFAAITLWTTFEDRGRDALAYAYPVKTDVSGLGRSHALRDSSALFGSDTGTLHVIVNMLSLGLLALPQSAWESHVLPIWGQEFGHRWMAYLLVRDPRTGRSSDVLLGRDCAHYSRFVDTQASVHDGVAWVDNRDGTFTAKESEQRYGDLDLYGMGLLAPDEVPPFFFIDNIPGYAWPGCGAAYDKTPRPQTQVIRGTRVDLTIEDVIAANGPRVPTAEEPGQDAIREVEVVVTQPGTSAQSPLVMGLVARIEAARHSWESWLAQATRKRMTVCTNATSDCGDARADLTSVVFNPSRVSPAQAVTGVDVVVSNGGTLAARDVAVSAAINFPGSARPPRAAAALPGFSLASNEERPARLTFDLHDVPCGTSAAVVVSSQSDRHRSRRTVPVLVGTESVAGDGFEAEGGWRVNPDGTDGAGSGTWERGTPERNLVQSTELQPEGAHTGQRAFVTGAMAGPASFVAGATTTLESPRWDARAMRAPQLRYWVWFASARAATSGGGLEPNPAGRLTVLARYAAEPSDAAAAPTGDAGTGGWVVVDELAGSLPDGWTSRTVPLPEPQGAAELQLRFVATEASGTAAGVEAAIDDVELLSNFPGCTGGGTPGDAGAEVHASSGCSCSAGRASPRAPFGWGALVAAALARAIRRRRRLRAR